MARHIASCSALIDSVKLDVDSYLKTKVEVPVSISEFSCFGEELQGSGLCQLSTLAPNQLEEQSTLP
jgi:hypothetical protein